MSSAAVILFVLAHLSYPVVFLFMAIESSFIPFPSEVVVPPAAWLALDEESGMNIFLVLVVATLGADVGALVNYWLARWLGRPVIYGFARSRLGHICLIDEEKVRKSEEFFRRHGVASTFFGRLIPAVRQLISIPAGLARMRLRPFLLYTTLGAFCWNAVLCGIGYCIFRFTPLKTVKDVAALATRYSHELGYVILALAVFVLAFIVYKSIKK